MNCLCEFEKFTRQGIKQRLSYFPVVFSRFQQMNNIAKYIAPRENTRWKNPYLYGTSSSNWTSSFRNWKKEDELSISCKMKERWNWKVEGLFLFSLESHFCFANFYVIDFRTWTTVSSHPTQIKVIKEQLLMEKKNQGRAMTAMHDCLKQPLEGY